MMKKPFAVFLMLALLMLCACRQDVQEKENSNTASQITEETASAVPETAGSLLASAQGEKLALPDYANNGGLYVRYQDSTYYRQYTADCYEKSGLWGYPDEIPGAKKKMMRMDADGRVYTLFEDDGNGGIFIDGKGNFYLQRLLSGDNNKYQVYSLDAKGNLRWTVSADVGGIYALDEKQNLLICADTERIFSVNASDGKQTLLAESETHFTPLLYDENGLLYYCEYSIGKTENGEAAGEYSLYQADPHGQDRKKVAVIPFFQLKGDAQERSILPDEPFLDSFRDFEIKHAHKDADSLFLFGAEYQGSGHFYFHGALIYIHGNGAWEEVAPEAWTPADAYGVFKPAYYATDGPFWSGEEKYDFVMYTAYGAAWADVLTENEIKSLGRIGSYGQQSYRFVSEISYAGRDIWFTIKDGDYDEEKAIGWRDAYAIKSTSVYRKDGAGGKIELVYEY